jgi:hypothetical protein
MTNRAWLLLTLVLAGCGGGAIPAKVTAPVPPVARPGPGPPPTTPPTPPPVTTRVTTAYGGYVFFRRFADTTGAEVTQATYSFCIQPLPSGMTSCAEGDGVVPDSSFIGNLVPNSVPNVLQLDLDTTIPGYVNTACNDPDFVDGCSSRVPATGGIISFVITNTELGETDVNDDGSGTVYNAQSLFDGTVIGTAVNSEGLTEAAFLNGGIQTWLPTGTILPTTMDRTMVKRFLAVQKALRVH